MQLTKVFAIAGLDGRTIGNKTLINFGIGVTELQYPAIANTEPLAASNSKN